MQQLDRTVAVVAGGGLQNAGGGVAGTNVEFSESGQSMKRVLTHEWMEPANAS